MAPMVAEKTESPIVAVADPRQPDEPSWWVAFLATPWRLDPRSLALFRVAVGMILMYDIGFRIRDLAGMYSDDAVIPLEMVREVASFPWQWSPFMLSGAWEWQAAMFALWGVAALALTLGWQTRLATIACWIFVASVHVRMPTVLSSGDELLRLLLFWSMFVPLGQVWSLDARWAGESRPNLTPVCSAGTLAIVWQICLVYLVTACFKWSDVWLEGRALLYALRPDQYGSPLGAWFLQWPALLHFLTLATLWLEFLGPAAILIPWGNAWFRLAAITAFTALHLGIHYCLNVGLFSEICIAAWWVLLPAMAWDAVPLRWLGDGISARVYGFSETAEQTESPAPAAAELSPPVFWAREATIVAFVVYCTLWNLNTLRETPQYGGRETVPTRWTWLMPSPCQSTAGYLALRQKWAMFAVPGRYSLWWIARARLSDGSEVDLMREGRPVEYVKPQSSDDCYANHRWDKHFRMISASVSRRYAQCTADFLARRWNDAHPPDRHVISLDLIALYAQVDIEPGAVSGDFESSVRAHFPVTAEKKRNLFAESLQALEAEAP